MPTPSQPLSHSPCFPAKLHHHSLIQIQTHVISSLKPITPQTHSALHLISRTQSVNHHHHSISSTFTMPWPSPIPKSANTMAAQAITNPPLPRHHQFTNQSPNSTHACNQFITVHLITIPLSNHHKHHSLPPQNTQSPKHLKPVAMFQHPLPKAPHHNQKPKPVALPPLYT